MKNLLITIFFLLSAGLVFAREHQMIDTLGSSPKGQYVALEEYGYRQEKNSYYVNIKVINVWTKQYVGQTFSIEVPAHNESFLKDARLKAKIAAKDDLKKFNISL
ncbi:MAG: hypothetical protein AB7I27_12525 [Bacteriovoracaceae bacterium]